MGERGEDMPKMTTGRTQTWVAAFSTVSLWYPVLAQLICSNAATSMCAELVKYIPIIDE